VENGRLNGVVLLGVPNDLRLRGAQIAGESAGHRQAPEMNGFAETVVKILKRECLDHFTEFGPAHLGYCYLLLPTAGILRVLQSAPSAAQPGQPATDHGGTDDEGR